MSLLGSEDNITGDTSLECSSRASKFSRPLMLNETSRVSWVNSSGFNKSLSSSSGRIGLYRNFFAKTPLSGSYAEHSAIKILPCFGCSYTQFAGRVQCVLIKSSPVILQDVGARKQFTFQLSSFTIC